jgi:hypothetical protein
MSGTRDLEQPFDATLINNDKKNSDLLFICLCFSSLLKITIFGASIYYSYYGIKMLWEYRDLVDNNPCSSSHLWQAVLVIIIFTISGLFKTVRDSCQNSENENKKNSASFSEAFCGLCISLIISLGVMIWNMIEVFAIPNSDYLNITDLFNSTNITACHELKNTAIWKFDWITVMIHIVCLGIIVVSVFIMGCITCFSK